MKKDVPVGNKVSDSYGNLYKAVEDEGLQHPCKVCAFFKDDAMCLSVKCIAHLREDHTNVVFQRVS